MKEIWAKYQGQENQLRNSLHTPHTFIFGGGQWTHITVEQIKLELAANLKEKAQQIFDDAVKQLQIKARNNPVDWSVSLTDPKIPRPKPAPVPILDAIKEKIAGKPTTEKVKEKTKRK